jgi:hypothetical protein
MMVSKTRLFVIIQGILCGLAGIVHGTYEILQGNSATGGNLLATIGAFTIIQNYHFTGIAAVCVALALIIWTVGFIHRGYGPAVFLLISILLFLVGGGVAQVAFLIMTWAVSTQINRPHAWMKKVFSPSTRSRLAKSWTAIFAAGYVSLGIGVAIWLFLTPPGTIFQQHVAEYLICWLCLILGFVLQIMTILSGFSFDLDVRHL